MTWFVVECNLQHLTIVYHLMFHISQQGSFHMSQSRHTPQRISTRNLRQMWETPFLGKHVIDLQSSWMIWAFPVSGFQLEARNPKHLFLGVLLEDQLHDSARSLQSARFCPKCDMLPVWSKYKKCHMWFTSDLQDMKPKNNKIHTSI